MKTLDELKAMSPGELYTHWRNAAFPFEYLPCGNCLSQHRSYRSSDCHDVRHAALIASMASLANTAPSNEKFAELLDELYALRLFYDHLYPQTQVRVDAAQQVKETVNG